MNRFTPRSSLDELRAKRPALRKVHPQKEWRLWLPTAHNETPIHSGLISHGTNNTAYQHYINLTLRCCSGTEELCYERMFAANTMDYFNHRNDFPSRYLARRLPE